jgi:hypothetical protein
MLAGKSSRSLDGQRNKKGGPSGKTEPAQHGGEKASVMIAGCSATGDNTNVGHGAAEANCRLDKIPAWLAGLSNLRSDRDGFVAGMAGAVTPFAHHPSLRRFAIGKLRR